MTGTDDCPGNAAEQDPRQPLPAVTVDDGRIVERSDTTTPSKNKTESARTLVERAFTTNYGRNTPLRCQHRRWRPRRPCGDTVPLRPSLETVVVADGHPTLQKCACVESCPDFPAGIDPRILLTLVRERVGQSPCTVEDGPVDPIARRTGSVRLELDGEGFTPTVSSWPRGSIATSPRARHRIRTARSRRSSRTGTVELASTESGRRDASRALTTGRSSVRGRRTDRPRIWSKSRSSAFCGDWVTSERYTTSSTDGRFPSASRRSVATNASDGPDTAASGRSSSSNRSDRHDGGPTSGSLRTDFPTPLN